jgi:hypothetical protein
VGICGGGAACTSSKKKKSDPLAPKKNTKRTVLAVLNAVRILFVHRLYFSTRKDIHRTLRKETQQGIKGAGRSFQHRNINRGEKKHRGEKKRTFLQKRFEFIDCSVEGLTTDLPYIYI